MGDISDKIFQRRKELGLTLEDVGKAVGVGKSTVRKWEKGLIKNMGRDKIALLANVLNMSPVELVPCDSQFDLERLNTEEFRLVTAYRGATFEAQQIALETLENHQKKKTGHQAG